MHPSRENGMAVKPTVRIDPDLFIKEFNNLARHKHRYEVFRDFVTTGALPVHNSFRGPRYDELEAEHLKGAGSYPGTELVECTTSARAKLTSNTRASAAGVWRD